MARKNISAEALLAMQEYEWQGNVRELENMIYRLVALNSEEIISKQSFMSELKATGKKAKPIGRTLEKNVEEHLKNYFAAHCEENFGDGLPPSGLYYRILPLVEKPLIEMTLAATGGNQLKAASVLGINRNTLRKKIAELGIG